MRDVSSMALSQRLAADGLPRGGGAIAGCSMTSALMAECLLIPDQPLIPDNL
jgi:hypothetical protein